MSKTNKPISDVLVQQGRPERTEGRQVNMPIELGSTMVFDTLGAFENAREARMRAARSTMEGMVMPPLTNWKMCLPN